MIARTWRCFVSSENAPRYVEHFEATVQSDLERLTGFQGAYILQSPLEDGLELTVMTLWDSMESIRGFAGDDVSVAVIDPALDAIARSYDASVTHSEVIFTLPGMKS